MLSSFFVQVGLTALKPEHYHVISCLLNDQAHAKCACAGLGPRNGCLQGMAIIAPNEGRSAVGIFVVSSDIRLSWHE